MVGGSEREMDVVGDVGGMLGYLTWASAAAHTVEGRGKLGGQ